MIKLMQGSEEINSNGGLSFVKRLLDGNARMKDWDAELPAAANSCYQTSAIVRSAIGLMTAGNSSYADIEKFRSDFLFRRLAGGSVPSQETFRQRLDALAELRPIRGRHFLHLLDDRRQQTVTSQIFDTHLFQCGRIRRRCDLGQRSRLV